MSAWLAPPGPTERWFFDAASGNLVSEDLVDTYSSETEANLTYSSAGPPATDLVSIKGNTAGGANFFINSPNSGLDIGNSDFTMVIQARSTVEGGAVQYVLDFINGGADTGHGITVVMASTNLDFTIGDGTNSHISRWSSPDFWHSDTWWTLTFQADRTQNVVSLIAKEAGQTAITPTLTQVGTALSSMGSINMSDNKPTFFARSPGGTSAFPGYISQVILEVGDNSYDLPTKP